MTDLPLDLDTELTDREWALLRGLRHGRYDETLVDGAVFTLDGDEEVAAVWGRDDQILWSVGEPLLLCGPAGVGKTTLIQQLILALIGVRKPEVLGLPVVEGKRVLYLASDRSRQAARSFRRMVGAGDRALLADRLMVWPGPVPEEISKNVGLLTDLATEANASVVVIDSLKDVAGDLADNEIGRSVARAFETLVNTGVELVSLHHQRKRTAGQAKPKTLDDVYGSMHLTAKAGSVILLWGSAGDMVVELIHLKQPADMVGPWMVMHDHDAGVSTVFMEVDLVNECRVLGGLSAKDAACLLESTDEPTTSQVERARRKLDKLAGDEGPLSREGGGRGGRSGSNATIWRAR